MSSRHSHVAKPKNLTQRNRGLGAFASWATLGAAAVAGVVLLLLLWSDRRATDDVVARSHAAEFAHTREARSAAVPRLRALPGRLRLDIDPESEGVQTEAQEDRQGRLTRAEGWDAGARGVIFVNPVLPPEAEAPALAQDTGLMFRDQPGSEDQPLEEKKDEPPTDSNSEASPAEINAEFGTPAPDFPVSLHERTAPTEEPPPVERFQDTGLVFSDSPAEGSPLK